MSFTTKQLLAIVKFLESRGYSLDDPFLGHHVMMTAGGDGSVWVSIDDDEFSANHQNFDSRGVRVL